MKIWIIIGSGATVLIVAIVAFGVVFSPGEPVQAAKVQRGGIREFVDERGKTRLPETYLITMPFAGRIEHVDFVEDDEVRQGEVVAKIVQTDLDTAVAEARAVVERFQKSIEENADESVEARTRQQALKFVESMVHTVAAAKERVKAGEKRMEYARSFYDDVVRLFQKNTRSQDDVDRADVARVESEVDYKQDALVWEAMKSIHAATALMPDLVTDYISRKALTGAVLEKQKAEAEARLQQMLTRLQRGRMVSPVDGVVLERLVSNERYLSAGTELLRIGQLDKLEVEAEILSHDVVDIRPGQQVEIYGPAIGATVGRGVSGVVQRVHPAGFTKISSLGVEQQRVKVIIQFAAGQLTKLRNQRDLGVDYRVRLRVFTQQKADALAVPRSALFRGADGGWEVFVVRGGRARLQPVQVGLLNDQRAEITDGLRENEIVVLAPESSLADGTKVKPIVRK